MGNSNLPSSCRCRALHATGHLPTPPPQDEALRLGPARRGGERGAAEKKIAILEKALSLHPGSDELLLALLHAVGHRGWGLAGAGPGGLGVQGRCTQGALASGCPVQQLSWQARRASSLGGTPQHGGALPGPRSNLALSSGPRFAAPQAEAVCDSGELERRWRAVLARHAGSPRLWRAYLHHRCARGRGAVGEGPQSSKQRADWAAGGAWRRR